MLFLNSERRPCPAGFLLEVQVSGLIDISITSSYSYLSGCYIVLLMTVSPFSELTLYYPYPNELKMESRIFLGRNLFSSGFHHNLGDHSDVVGQGRAHASAGSWNA
jgi:hypothetical protein